MTQPLSPPPPPAARPMRAVAWMTGTVLSFMLIAVAARELKEQLDVSEMMLFRAIIGAVILFAVLALRGRLGNLRTRQPGRHLIRNGLHYIGQMLWFQALLLIPLAQLFALEFTTPIFIVLLSWVLLGERVSRMQLLATLVGFAGVLVVARPDFSDLSPGVLAGAACALFFALYALMTRRLTQSETAESIVFWQVAMQVPLGLLAAGWDLQIALPQGSRILLTLAVGICGLTAHYCLARALGEAPPAFVYPLDYIRLPLGVLAGWLFYNEVIDIAVFAGAALILLGNWMNIRYGARTGPGAPGKPL